MKRIMCIILLLSLLGLIFGAAQEKRAEAEQPVTVIGMGPVVPPYRYEVFEQIVAQFEQENPNIKIEWRNTSSWPETEAKALTAIAGGDPPDILWQWITSFPTFASKGLLEDLGPYVEQDPTLNWDMLYPSMVETATFNGKHYGIPNDALTAVLFYNKDIFEKVGIQEPPKTFEELREIGKKIKNYDDELWGYATFSKVKRTVDGWIIEYLYPNGGTVMNADFTEPAFNNAKGINALQMAVDNVHKDGFQAPLGTQADDLWVKGKVGMVTFWPWLVGYTEQYAPNLNYGCALVVGGEAGQLSAGGAHILTILKDGKHKEEAYKFISFLFRPDIDKKWHIEMKFLPVTKAIMNDSYYQNHHAWRVFGEQLEQMQPFPIFPQYLETVEILNEELENAYMGIKQPKQALDDAAQKVLDALQ